MKLIDNIKDTKSVYEPYKYVMADTGNIYIGAKYTYNELLESEDVGFKMKAIITHYILKESDADNSLESEFYFMEKTSFTYKTFVQLKTKVKVQMLEEKRTLFGKKKVSYTEKVLKLDELIDINLAKKKGAGIVIEEIAISKLALMSFSV